MGSGGKAISRREVLAGGLGAGASLVVGSAEAAKALPEIPVFDAREVGLIGLAKASIAQMKALLGSCLGPLTPGEFAGVAVADALAKEWLANTGTPYAAELDAIAALLPQAGVYLLNTAYEWGCTTLAAPAPDRRSARLLRSLDWSFDGLGRGILAVRQRGPAGDFVNLTWPGAVGVLTALAPGRFAATINQAPPREGADEGQLAALMGLGRHFVATSALPPMHLLRSVFEKAANFAEARRLIEATPIAAPTIFTLVGTAPEETCVIERTETEHVTHAGTASAANTWRYADFRDGWAGRDRDKQSNSAERRRRIEELGMTGKPFAWVRPPVRNANTRLAVELDPARGEIRARGYERQGDSDDSVPATADLHLVDAPA